MDASCLAWSGAREGEEVWDGEGEGRGGRMVKQREREVECASARDALHWLGGSLVGWLVGCGAVGGRGGWWGCWCRVRGWPRLLLSLPWCLPATSLWLPSWWIGWWAAGLVGLGMTVWDGGRVRSEGGREIRERVWEGWRRWGSMCLV